MIISRCRVSDLFVKINPVVYNIYAIIVTSAGINIITSRYVSSCDILTYDNMILQSLKFICSGMILMAIGDMVNKAWMKGAEVYGESRMEFIKLDKESRPKDAPKLSVIIANSFRSQRSKTLRVAIYVLFLISLWLSTTAVWDMCRVSLAKRMESETNKQGEIQNIRPITNIKNSD